MTTVLVTGASGFVGRHLAAHLAARGDDVVCLVRGTSNRAPLEKLGVRFAVGDMTRKDTLPRALDGVDVVYHSASLLKVPWKQAFYDDNVSGAANVAEACARAKKPPVLIVVSSLTAGGPSPEDTPRRERDVSRPVSIYGRVKLAAEDAATQWAGAVPMTIVRPPMVFGEGDPTSFKLFASIARGWHVVPGMVPRRVAMVHAKDLALALSLAAERGERVPTAKAPGQGGGEGLYYAADAELPLYAELGALVSDALGGARARVVRVPDAFAWCAAAASEAVARVRDVPSFLNLDKAREAASGSWICDTSKARGEIGFYTAPLRDRLRQTADWYREQGWLSKG